MGGCFALYLVHNSMGLIVSAWGCKSGQTIVLMPVNLTPMGDCQAGKISRNISRQIYKQEPHICHYISIIDLLWQVSSIIQLSASLVDSNSNNQSETWQNSRAVRWNGEPVNVEYCLFEHVVVEIEKETSCSRRFNPEKFNFESKKIFSGLNSAGMLVVLKVLVQ